MRLPRWGGGGFTVTDGVKKELGERSVDGVWQGERWMPENRRDMDCKRQRWKVKTSPADESQ